MTPGDLGSTIGRSLRERTTDAAQVQRWLEGIEEAGQFSVERRDVSDLDSWSVDTGTGDIAHASGRFFSIRGADVSIRTPAGETHWQQPVIVQPDVGVLGLVASPVDGVLQFLVQAKMEPGNRRLVQVSPTVQATASNFQRIHKGSATPFLERFQDAHLQPGFQTVLVEQLQTEQANRYLRKRNLNSVVVVDHASLTVDDDRFRWLTLGDLIALSDSDDLLHMDTRSILGSVPFTADHPADDLDLTDVRRWIDQLASTTHVTTTPIPLNLTYGWGLRDGRIVGPSPSPFEVVGVRVTASSREVAAWDQPLVHNAPGMAGTLVVQKGPAGLRVLACAMTGLGVRDSIELGPTLVDWPAGEHDVPLAPQQLELRNALAQASVLFDRDLPEEGGRFFHSSTRHRILEVPPDDPVPIGTTHRWLTLAELRGLARSGSAVNMELRSLLSCLPVSARITG